MAAEERSEEYDDAIGVYIIAPNRLLRETLARTLRQRARVEVLGASDRVFDRAPVPRPQVVLVSAASVLPTCLETIRRIRQLVPEASVLLFGMEENLDLFFQAVRAGVAGYLLAEASAAELVEAVRAVARDEAVCPPRLCRALFRWFATQAALPSPQLCRHHGLTRREQQLLPLLARGLTDKVIAAELHLAEQTVKNHVHRILRKLGSNNRLEALARLDGAGWRV